MRVKICGMTRTEDARQAERAGADYIGAILVPSSPRRIEAADARALADAVRIPLVLVTAGLTPEANARAAEASGARVVQLHGEESPADLLALRALGDWELWKALRVRTGAEAGEALDRYEGSAELLLLDGWHPNRLGGSGRVFPWEVVAEIRDRVPPSLRLGVAGGLTPQNVGTAIERLAPDLVDVSSGVELEPGVKDPALVRAFIEAARATRA